MQRGLEEKKAEEKTSSHPCLRSRDFLLLIARYLDIFALMAFMRVSRAANQAIKGHGDGLWKAMCDYYYSYLSTEKPELSSWYDHFKSEKKASSWQYAEMHKHYRAKHLRQAVIDGHVDVLREMKLRAIDFFSGNDYFYYKLPDLILKASQKKTSTRVRLFLCLFDVSNKPSRLERTFFT